MKQHSATVVAPGGTFDRWVSTLESGFARCLVGIGLLLALSALVLDPAGLIALLRPELSGDRRMLVDGAQIFRVCLTVLGIVVTLLGFIPAPQVVVQKSLACEAQGERAQLAILAAILLAALAIRLYGLNTGLWIDEVLTYIKYMKMPFGESITTYDSQNQHFVYSLFAHASTQLFGESYWSSRIPAVIFGVGSIWALYALAREVTSPVESLFSTALLAVAYHHIWFSQTARGYTGLLFWTILASWLFLLALRSDRPGIWIGYAVTAALGAYTHLTMIFVVCGHFLWYLGVVALRGQCREPVAWRAMPFGFILAGLLTVQLYALVLPQFFGGTLQQESHVQTWMNPLWTILEIARGLQIGFAGGVAGVAAMIVFGAGLVDYCRTRPVIVALLILPCLLLGGTMVVLGHHLWPRFFFFGIGFAVLVVVRGAVVAGRPVSRLLRLPRWQTSPFGLAICAGLVAMTTATVPLAYRPKQDYQAALDFIVMNEEPGDMVLTAGAAAFPYSTLYKTSWEKVESAAQLRTVRATAHRTWVVYTLPDHMQAVYPELLSMIQSDFVPVRRFSGSLSGGEIYVYRAESARD
jgi:hypothetical protein